MEIELNQCEMHIIRTSGVALLCQANAVIEECIIPSRINQNHGYAPDAKVFYDNKEIGNITASKIKKGKLYYIVKFNDASAFETGVYGVSFDINKMFSNFSGSKYFLDQIIVESITIETKIN